MAGLGTSDTDYDCYDTESSKGTESDDEGCFLDSGFQPQIAPSCQACAAAVQHHLFVLLCTINSKAAALASLRNMWQSTPRSWQGSDPCGSQWDGITCKNSRIIYIQLSSIGLKGSLTGDILSLTELQILKLSHFMMYLPHLLPIQNATGYLPGYHLLRADVGLLKWPLPHLLQFNGSF